MKKRDNSENDAATSETEVIEGIDDSNELDMANYPLDSLLIRHEGRSIHEVCRRIKNDNYIMDPDFQRDFIWPPDKQSKLIESLLMRIPLPVFYLAERADGKIIVIDGLQRLTTISRFLDNDFPLRSLDDANEAFKGKRFQDLPIKLQNRIEDTQLILYILDEKVPERARLDIFERVNGGTPLSRQQMRNCMYSGKATKLLSDLVKEQSFIEATGNSLNRRTMRDREFINRFMAFYILGVDKYKGDMDQFLANALEEINTYTSEQIDTLKKAFLASMDINYKIFGKFAFRKHREGQTGRNVINASLFDIFSVSFAAPSMSIYEDYASKIFNIFDELQDNSEFQRSITHATNGSRQVRARFKYINKMLRDLL